MLRDSTSKLPQRIVEDDYSANLIDQEFYTLKHRTGLVIVYCSLLGGGRLQILLLNTGGPPIEVPSLWGTWMQPWGILMMHPEKRWIKDSFDRFLHTPGQDTRRRQVWAYFPSTAINSTLPLIATSALIVSRLEDTVVNRWSFVRESMDI